MERLPYPARQRGCGRDLDQLLVTALQAAVPVAEVADLTAVVGGDLHLHVAHGRQQLLDENAVRVERGAGLRDRAPVGVFDLIRRSDDSHPASAAAADRLDQHRGAGGEFLEEGAGLVQAHRFRDPRNDRHAMALGEGAGTHLVAEQLEGLPAAGRRSGDRLRCTSARSRRSR